MLYSIYIEHVLSFCYYVRSLVVEDHTKVPVLFVESIKNLYSTYSNYWHYLGKERKGISIQFSLQEANLPLVVTSKTDDIYSMYRFSVPGKFP